MSSTSPNLPRFLDEAKSLACIHCGLCLGSCPTYLETGNENDSPRGRIYLMRALQEGRLPLVETAVRHIDNCLGCRACEAACPSGVHYGELLEATRDHIERHHRRSTFQTLLRRVLIERVFPHPGRMKLALVPARLLKWAMKGKVNKESRRAGEGRDVSPLLPSCSPYKASRFLPKFLRDALALLPEEMREGDLPELSRACGIQPGFIRKAGGQEKTELPASSCPPALLIKSSLPRGRVGFIRGCVMNVLFGRTNENTLWLLNLAGYDVVTPRDQGCCGALHAHGGNLAAARAAARANLDAFAREPLDAIIINAAGCGSTLKEYAHLLPDDPRAAAFSAKVKDLSEFLVESGPHSTLNFQLSTQLVSFHDACHLAHAQRITHAPRVLVKAVAGDNYVEMPESDVCCGSAGSYNLTEPAMAERLQVRKVANILRSGATCVVTTNPGCLLQMRAGLDQAGAGQVETIHLADYLARALRPLG
jgi:glycolate oxidase iron-sulfur subunit